MRTSRSVRDLGPCCNCGTTKDVVNIVMLNRLAPVPGHGWGCAVCGLDADGAVAVLCDGCVRQEVRSVCKGYPSEGERVPVDELPAGEFKHRDVPH